MKTQILMIIALCSALTVRSQQQAFSNVTYSNVNNWPMISFTVPCEVNVKNYRIEAGNDKVNFEVIGTLKATGNSMLAKKYVYNLAGYTYKYYRVGMLTMNAKMEYSAVIIPSAESHSMPEKQSRRQAEETNMNAVTRK